MSHYPVMVPEVLESLNPVDGEIYVDGTFGAGGYTKAILDRAQCTVVAIDRDPEAVERAAVLHGEYGDRFVFVRGCFGDVEGLLRSIGVEAVDGFVLDVGVSSMQLDDGARGFSFRFDAPLDMRMDNADGETAAHIINTRDEGELADIIYKFGEERRSRRIARKIVERRSEGAIKTTGELAELVRSCLPKARKGDIDPATRTFQALRIAVNDELGELERALEASERILNPGGRLVVVSFHSLEDRIVKNYMREKSGGAARVSRYLPEDPQGRAAVFDLPVKKAIRPSEKELGENPRSRSARLRVAVRAEEAS